MPPSKIRRYWASCDLATEWATQSHPRQRGNARLLSSTEPDAETLLATRLNMPRVLSRIPMGRLGNPEELGGGRSHFLLSDAASYNHRTGHQRSTAVGWRRDSSPPGWRPSRHERGGIFRGHLNQVVPGSV